jgi:hypothetical protein
LAGLEAHVTDIVLRDIDPVLADRIRQLAEMRRWDIHDTLLRLIEQGLIACESGQLVHFDEREADVLRSVIDALEHEPDDSGFGLIGHAAEPPPPTHVLDRWVDDLKA